MLELFKKFLWTLPFICFIAGYFLITRLYPVKEIETPSVVSKTIQEACSILANHNLNARLVTRKEDPLLPDGTVISQTPLAGQKIKPNQTVYIVASIQPEKNTAPDYIHKQLSECEQDLTAKNIRTKIYPMPSVLGADTCLAQWPEPGLPLENNKMILYVAHTINKPIIIPNVKNKPVLDVVDFLKTNSIEVEVIHNNDYLQEQHTCSNCTILDQRPLAGSIITHDAQKPIRMQLHVASS